MKTLQPRVVFSPKSQQTTDVTMNKADSISTYQNAWNDYYG